jgi:hypothetical protein
MVFFVSLIGTINLPVMESHYTKIYTGSYIIAQLIQTRLEDIGIEPILKDEFKTGLRAVLVTEYPSIIEVYVHEDQLQLASPVVQEVLADLELSQES